MFTRERAKVTLKNRRWTYRSAAPELGVTYQHLSEVLNGRRQSKRLLCRVMGLPIRPTKETGASAA
jgi:hypothetical protein